MAKPIKIAIVLLNLMLWPWLSAKLYADQFTKSLAVKVKVIASCRVTPTNRSPDNSLDRFTGNISKNVSSSCANPGSVIGQDMNQKARANDIKPSLPANISYEAAGNAILMTVNF